MKIDIKAIIIALLVLVILFLDPCNFWRKKELPQQPKVKTETQQRKEVANNEDSINAIIAPFEDELQAKDKIIAKVSNELLNGQDKILKLQQDNDSLLSLLKAGDLASSLNESAEKIRAQIRKNDSLCNKNISALNRQVTLKSNIITQKDRLYSKLKSSLDTCLKNQTALEKYSKQIKPLREVTIAAKVITNYVFPLKPNAGVEVGYRNKKGTEYSVGYYTNQQISVGVKKTLFKF